MKIETHAGNVLLSDDFTRADVTREMVINAIIHFSNKGVYYLYELLEFSDNNGKEIYPKLLASIPYFSKEEESQIYSDKLSPERFVSNKYAYEIQANRLCDCMHPNYILKSFNVIAEDDYLGIVINLTPISCSSSNIDTLRLEAARIQIESLVSDSLSELAHIYKSCIASYEKRELIQDFKADTLSYIKMNKEFNLTFKDNKVAAECGNLLLEEQIKLLKTIEQIYPHELDIVINTVGVDKQKLIDKRLTWNGNTNTLVDMFYQMAFELKRDGVPLLLAEPKDIIRFIQDNFKDKYGDIISETTIRTIITPSRVDKRPKGNKKLNLQEFYSEEYWDDDLFVIVR